MLLCTTGIWLIGRPGWSEKGAVSAAEVHAQDTAALSGEFYEPAGTGAGRNRASARAAFLAKTTGAPAKSSPAFISLLGDAASDGNFLRSAHSNASGFYGGDWRPANVVAASQGTALYVRRAAPDVYSMAEIKTGRRYGFGRYETVMKVARGSGLVSAFFTYTGPSDGSRHDEVDIEFLGMDTAKVHFNYFRNGRRGTPATFDLPFDAADGFHHYAFNWSADRIAWYVDGEKVYETVPGDTRIPQNPGRIFASNWTGKPYMRDWHGAPGFGDAAAAEVACISHTPEGESGRSCADIFLDQPF
jgi:beta-glucanase (GH16 family)